MIGEVVEFGVRQLGAVLSGLGRRRIAFSVWEVRRFLHSWRSAGCGIVGLDWERKCSWWWECRGADKVLARQELVGWRREDTGFGAETPWHERSLLDPSVPDACADVQYSTRIRRGFGPGRVPL